MKSVLILGTDVYSKGGIQRYTRYQFKAVENIVGHGNVSLFSLSPPQAHNQFEEPIEVAYTGQGASLLSKLKYCWAVIKFVKRHKVDTIIAAHVQLSVIAYICRKIWGARCLTNVYGLEIWSGLKWRDTLGLLKSDGLIGDCKFILDYIDQHYQYKGQTFLLYDPVDTNRFSSGVVNESLRVKYQITKASLTVMTVGRLDRNKGHELVINALAQLGSGVQYIIVGGGKYETVLKNLVASLKLEHAVMFVGRVPESELVDWYRLADVIVLLSTFSKNEGEGLPLGLIEGAACGKPIICGDQDGSQEAYHSAQPNGFLLDPCNLNQLIEALKCYRDQPELLREHGQAARQYVLNHFKFELFEQQLRALLTEQGLRLNVNNTNKTRSAVTLFLPMLLGSLIGLGVTYYWLAQLTDSQGQLETFALGEATSVYFATVDGTKVHCSDHTDIEFCLDQYRQTQAERLVLWLGNSQLHAINQMKQGDETAVPIMHRLLKQNKTYFMTLSQPNASLQEHYLLFEYLLSQSNLDTLVLPVFFDDTRETGIRAELAPLLKDAQLQTALMQTQIGSSLVVNHADKNLAGNDRTALKQTVQENMEAFLNDQMNDHSIFWQDRADLRGALYVTLYRLRNWVFNINPSTIRKVIPARYALNMQALEAIMSRAETESVRVLVYIPPLRNDVAVPYDLAAYAQFKQKVAALAQASSGVRFSDLENLVPGKYWGTKESTSFDGSEELDFMHFQAEGHKLLAKALYQELTRMQGVLIGKNYRDYRD